jgi:hypothetical protein
VSASRRLRRLARRAQLTPRALSPEAAKHGCAECRADATRHALVRELLESGRASEMVQDRGDGLTAHQPTRCEACGAFWSVCFFPDEKGELCVRFAPMAPPGEVN